MKEIVDKFIKEIEDYNFNNKQKEYYLFMLLKTIKDSKKRELVQKYLREKEIACLKSYFMATIFQINDDYSKFVTEIDKLKLVDNSYKNILKKTKDLANELNITNSLEISNLYTYLLWNGYYSKDTILKFQPFKRSMINNHYSFDIMSGIGVCLNFSDMLTDIINLYDYNAASIINIFDIKQKKNYIPEIERQIAKVNIPHKIKSKIIEPLANKVGNHAFTLINENDNMYIYDPTNFMIFNIDNRFKCSNMCGTGNCTLKPVFSHIINHSKKSDIALGNLNLNTNYNSPYNRKDFILTFENCIENFNNNKSLIIDFHNDIYNNIEFINNNSKDLKRLIKEKKQEYKKSK